jgi:multimeric flavodoxin WrbA
MKVVAFSGSARKDGNTAILVNYIFDELKKEGIETELIQFAGKKINGCMHAGSVLKTKTDSASRKMTLLTTAS